MKLKQYTVFTLFLAVVAGNCTSAFAVTVESQVKELIVYKDLGVGPCDDVFVEGDMAYFIGRGKLYITDISDPANPTIINTVEDLGNTRQICVKNDIAYIVSRENGLYIINAENPKSPVVASHYDTIEIATGVGISGHVLFVANRTFGVEIVDVADPENPMYLSVVRAGESQSVDIVNRYLYIGIHGAKQLVTADISDPYHPTVVSTVKLDGQGDGIYVRDNYLFVSTGNKSRTLPNGSPGDPGYGAGHGLEIFSLENPAMPSHISTVKFDRGHFFSDQWTVEVAGDYAFCSDTRNGVYIVNISDYKKPFIIAYKKFPSEDSGEESNCIGGVAVTEGCLYAAGRQTDLHIFQLPGVAVAQTREYDESVQVGPPPEEKLVDYELYKPGGQIHAVAVLDGHALCAAGSDGFRVVDIRGGVAEINHYETEGFALDVAVHGNHAFVVDAGGHLSVWKNNGVGSYERVSVYTQSNGFPLKKIVIPDNTSYAVVQAGMSTLEIIDINDPIHPTPVLTYSTRGYINGIVGRYLAVEKFLCTAWHMSGMAWFDLSGTVPKETGKFLQGKGIRSILPLKDSCMVFKNNGYVFAEPDSEQLSSMPMTDFPDGDNRIIGEFARKYNQILSSNRKKGLVFQLELDANRELLVEKTIATGGHPGMVCTYKDDLLIPDGRIGLKVYRNFFN